MAKMTFCNECAYTHEAGHCNKRNIYAVIYKKGQGYVLFNSMIKVIGYLKNTELPFDDFCVLLNWDRVVQVRDYSASVVIC